MKNTIISALTAAAVSIFVTLTFTPWLVKKVIHETVQEGKAAVKEAIKDNCYPGETDGNVHIMPHCFHNFRIINKPNE